MNKEKEMKKLVPELRFKEFEGEWEVKKLGDDKVSFFVNDKIVVNEINVETYVSTENLLPNYGGFSKPKKLPKSGSFTKYEKGDILIANIRPYLKKVWFAKLDGASSNDVLVIRTSSTLQKEYLQYILKNDTFINYVMKGAKGVKMPRGDKSLMLKYLVPFPKPKEQQKIANCLSSLDDLIQTETEKLASLKEHKNGILQQLFPSEGETVPKLRFKEFEDDGEWGLKKFEEMFSIGSGKDYKHLPKGNIPVYGTGGYMCSVNDYLYDGESACIGRKGTIDKPILLSGKFWTVDTLFYTHSFKKCTPSFVYLLFQNINWREHNEAGGIPSLSKVIIRKIEVRIPNHQEQQKIVDTLSSLDDNIQAQATKIESLKVHKKGLMQQLFPSVNN